MLCEAPHCLLYGLWILSPFCHGKKASELQREEGGGTKSQVSVVHTVECIIKTKAFSSSDKIPSSLLNTSTSTGQG